MQGIKNQKMRRAIDRRNLYLSVIDYFDGVINFNKISKKIYIPIDEVKTDLKLLGLFDENKEELPEYFEKRRINYENYFNELGYKPYKSVVSEYFGYSMKTVSEDFDRMGITNKDLSRENYRIEIEKTAISRLEDYKKYYFEADKNRNMSEVAKNMGLSRPTVLRDITYLKELYGEEIDKVKCDVIAEKEKKEKELRNRQKIREKEKLEREKLTNYVIENYFTSLYYIRGEKLCENLGITKRELNNIRDYILRTNNTVFVRARYWNSVTFKYDNVPLDIKILSYKKYIENVKKLHTISDLKEMALYLRLSIDEVFSDFKLEIVQNEVCVIDVSDNTIKSVVTRNSIIKREERLEVYKNYFKENKIFTSFKDLSFVLGYHPTTISKDFREFDLYNILNLEKVNKGKRQILSEDEIQKRKERASQVKLERLNKYEDYFNRNGCVQTLTVLSEIVGIDLKIVSADFREFSLSSKYLVCSMSDSRLAAYNRFFSDIDFVDTLRELSEKINISYDAIRRDFKNYNLYSIYSVGRRLNTFETRLNAYNKFFEENDSVESIRQIAVFTELPYPTVLQDFRKEPLLSRYNQVHIVRDVKKERIELYLKCLGDNKIHSIRELSRILNYSYYTVLSDFKENTYLLKYLVRVQKDKTLKVKNLETDVKLKKEKEPKIIKREQRKEYYFINYFNADRPKPPTIMAKELGVGYDIVRRDLRNLSKEYNVSLRDVSEFKGYRYEQRKSFYLNSEELLSVSELAEKFGVGEATIYNDLKRIYEELKQE